MHEMLIITSLVQVKTQHWNLIYIEQIWTGSLHEFSIFNYPEREISVKAIQTLTHEELQKSQLSYFYSLPLFNRIDIHNNNLSSRTTHKQSAVRAVQQRFLDPQLHIITEWVIDTDLRTEVQSA
jgi:hypothetical protein